LYELARGIDNNQVVPNRPTKSISAEDTFERDVALSETEPMIRRLAETVWIRLAEGVAHRANCGPQTEDTSVQYLDTQSYARVAAVVL